MRGFAWLAAAALVLAPPGLQAQGRSKDGTVVRGRLGEELDQAVRRAGGDAFWGAVLVGREGEILLARGYGSADYGETPNTPHTLFELASASKQVAGAAVLHLQQKKKLAVTDTLDELFKDVPEDKRAIQVHHLLTHTSGISGSVGVPYASPIGRQEYVRRMLAEPLNAAPGERYEYSNAGYALLAAVVEVVSKKSFEDYVEKNLFTPAKMKDTGFIGDRDLIRTGRASARKSKEPGEWTAASWHWGWGYRGMGGVVTTVHDLWAWDRALRDGKVLDEDALEAWYTPFLDGYAYGWRVDVTPRGTRKAHHSGGVAGYGTNVVRYLEDDLCIFVLSNEGAHAHQVTGALEELLFEPVELEAELDLKPYDVGADKILQLPDGLVWKAGRKRGRLVLELVDGKHVALEVRAPAGYAAKLTAELEQAIASRAADDDGAPAALEAGFYLQAYDTTRSKLTLEGLRLEVRPEYRGRDAAGKEVVDRRPLLILRGEHGWPVMVKMNVAAARALLAAVEAA